MNQRDAMIGSSIELPASHYTVIGFGDGDGQVNTYQGAMSNDEASLLLIARLEDCDWSSAMDSCVLEEILDIATLMAEVNLYQARLLWSIKVPESFGMPAMLSKAHEENQLRYLKNLAIQRTPLDATLVNHILDEGAFMASWGSKSER